jgi:hypothetical protein
MSQYLLAQQSSAAVGRDLASKAQQGGWYPLLVIGGVIVLIAVFVFIAKTRRN